MRKLFFIGLMLILGACEGSGQAVTAKPELLVYCGITMAHPIQEIARILEAKHGFRVTITQGGSEDPYQSIGGYPAY